MEGKYTELPYPTYRTHVRKKPTEKAGDPDLHPDPRTENGQDLTKIIGTKKHILLHI